MAEFTELNCCGMAELFYVGAPLAVLRQAVETKLGEDPDGDCTEDCVNESCGRHQDAMDTYPWGSGFLIASTTSGQRQAVSNLKTLGFKKLAGFVNPRTTSKLIVWGLNMNKYRAKLARTAKKKQG